MKISELMSRRIISIDQDESVAAAARSLRRNNIGALPVCDCKGQLRGMITDRDIVTRCVATDMNPSETRIREIMSRGVVTVGPDETIRSAAKQMGLSQLRRLPVTDNGHLIGMISLCDLARSNDCCMETAQALSEISSNCRKL